MTRDEVINLFKLIKSFYPNFEVTTEKVNNWAWAMRKMDFDRVMVRAQEHVQENKFPPTIAEVAAFAPEKNEHLEKIREWEKEAAQVPQSVKDEFRRKVNELFKEKRK